ncbi:hypothetical protein POTOM_005841 [Populus tomentosa]|uniref:BHLH domain-containing protein n=1 Tax=Populus tomentosa TaxID=118781 RepID=A0A8X8AMI6_POPTO|nr:hypothetical protein POTOM_005841 [Populus tomentosa]
MEPIGATAEGEWSSLSRMYTSEEADFMEQLLVNCPPNQVDSSSSFGVPSSFWPNHESTMNMEGANECLLYSLDIADTNPYQFSQVSSGYSGDSYVVDGDDFSNQELSNGNVEESGGNQTVAALPEPESNLQPKRESKMPASELPLEDKSGKPPENSKKRSRRTGDVSTITSIFTSLEFATDSMDGVLFPVVEGIATSFTFSRHCLIMILMSRPKRTRGMRNAAQRMNPMPPGAQWRSEFKFKLKRGQQLSTQVAKQEPKRRERINERLRILQNLVPNGTKVDISTMLEEAVQYVKFLQLQIKLLSSEDLWMYAPIAYNGMDIDLDHLKLTTPRR